MLHHRMAAALDVQQGLLGEIGLNTIERRRALGEAGQHVELGDRRGGFLEPRQLPDQKVQQRFVQFLLAAERSIAGAEHLVLESLELRGDEALGGFDGLAALIVFRDGLPPGSG